MQLLDRELQARQPDVEKYEKYYAGDHNLRVAAYDFRNTFRGLLKPLANNWCQLVVDAAVERLHVQGFRFGTAEGARSWDDTSDKAAWDIWQRNSMDARSAIAHQLAVKTGTAYVMVEPADDYPRLTIEHPSQVYVMPDPTDPYKRLAAIKKWQEIDGHLRVNLYLPDMVYKWRSAAAKGSRRAKWLLVEESTNPLGEVPIVPIVNDPDLLTGGTSDLQEAVPISDAINKLANDLLASAAYNAYPQRYATGVEVPTLADGVTPDPAYKTKFGPGQILTAEAPDAKYGSLQQGNVEAFIRPIDMYIETLAGVTRTPNYYLKGSMANLSADAIRASDTGLVYRVKSKQIYFGEAWEAAMRLAFRAAGDLERASVMHCETLWLDPEPRSIGQLVDAAVKLNASLGVPKEMALQVIGFSPQQITQAMEMMGFPSNGPASNPAS